MTQPKYAVTYTEPAIRIQNVALVTSIGLRFWLSQRRSAAPQNRLAMNYDAALAFIDSTLVSQTGKHLSDLQGEIVRGTWEGKTYETIAQAAYCSEGHVRDVAADFWKQLSELLGERIGKKNCKSVLGHHLSLESPPESSSTVTQPPSTTARHLDWGDAPDIPTLFGRTEELATLQQWILTDRCRAIALLGMGGIGKTSLASTLAQTIQSEFDWIAWRSLRNSLPVRDLLTYLLKSLPAPDAFRMPAQFDAQLLELLDRLRHNRGLIVLDNLESILQGGDRLCPYRQGYEGYGELFRIIGETAHTSCLLVTSREPPQGWNRLASTTQAVRLFPVTGLSPESAQELLQSKGEFAGSERDWQRSIEHYAGNPLALTIIASTILDFFDGSLAQFLDFSDKESFVLDDIRDLLDQHLDRLTPIDRRIMHHLAIAQEPLSLQDLQTNSIEHLSAGDILCSLSALQNRSLIYKVDGKFTQQSVVMEYAIARAIDILCREFETGDLDLAIAQPLFNAEAKDFVREAQSRLVVRPFIEKAIATFKSPVQLVARLKAILETLRGKPVEETGYAAGNIINILTHMQVNLTGFDFSQLVIHQAYLPGIPLHHVNFSQSDLTRSAFSTPLGSVLSVAISLDGQVFTTGDSDGHIRLWETRSGRQLLNLSGHENWVCSVAISPDGKHLASGSADNTVKLWEVETGQCLKTFAHHSSGVFCVTFHPDGEQFASSSADGSIVTYSVDHCESIRTLNCSTKQVYAIAYSPDGKYLASGSADGAIVLWSTRYNQCLTSFAGDDCPVYSLTFSPDSLILASGNADGTIALWSLPDGTLQQTLVGHGDWVKSLNFHPDGHTLISGSVDRTVMMWSRERGQCMQTLMGHRNSVWSVACCPDGRSLISGSFDQTVKFWDFQTGRCYKTLAGYSNDISSVAFHPSGDLLASGSSDRKVRLWNVKTRLCQKTFDGHASQVCSVAFVPDGSVLVSGSFDRTLRLWETASERWLTSLVGHSGSVCAVACSHDGKTLASGSLDRTVKLWQASTGECLHTLSGHKDGVWCVAFSHESGILASGSADRTILLWKTASAQLVKSMSGHQSAIWSLAFSHEDRILASGSADGTVKLWNLNDGQCFTTLTGHENWVFSVAFSPDGQTLASGSFDGTVRLWDLRTHECRHVCQERSGKVYAVAFSPDGTTLASGSQHETIDLWDVRSGKHVDVLRVEQLYEDMNIRGARGLSPAQLSALKELGALTA